MYCWTCSILYVKGNGPLSCPAYFGLNRTDLMAWQIIQVAVHHHTYYQLQNGVRPYSLVALAGNTLLPRHLSEGTTT